MKKDIDFNYLKQQVDTEIKIEALMYILCNCLMKRKDFMGISCSHRDGKFMTIVEMTDPM